MMPMLPMRQTECVRAGYQIHKQVSQKIDSAKPTITKPKALIQSPKNPSHLWENQKRVMNGLFLYVEGLINGDVRKAMFIVTICCCGFANELLGFGGVV
jgi:hypothetical protein